MRGIELQLRTRSTIRPTKHGEALTFGFSLGPIKIFVIAHMPESKDYEESPLVYVKINLQSDDNWQIFKEHTAESSQHVYSGDDK